MKNKYYTFQRELLGRQVTVAFKKENAVSLFMPEDKMQILVSTSIQHPELDDPNPEIGKKIAISRLESKKRKDKNWGCVAIINKEEKELFNSHVLEEIANSIFIDIHKNPHQYIAAFNKKK